MQRSHRRVSSQFVLCDGADTNVTSTAIRKAMEAGGSLDAVEGDLHPSVAKYLQENCSNMGIRF